MLLLIGCTGDLSVEPLVAEQLYERYKDAYIENTIEIARMGRAELQSL